MAVQVAEVDTSDLSGSFDLTFLGGSQYWCAGMLSIAVLRCRRDCLDSPSSL